MRLYLYCLQFFFINDLLVLQLYLDWGKNCPLFVVKETSSCVLEFFATATNVEHTPMAISPEIIVSKPTFVTLEYLMKQYPWRHFEGSHTAGGHPAALGIFFGKLNWFNLMPQHAEEYLSRHH